MLNGIDGRITPTLLHCLARMGHGDDLVIADANFAADSTARHCVVDRPIPLAGLDAVQAIDVITGLLPLDGFGDFAALRMEIDGDAQEMGEVHHQAWAVLRPRLPEGGQLTNCPRPRFYDHAKTAFAVVQTAETRPFGCFILKKGVVF
ncbi:RbsD/FucU family protein [Pseudooceanicola aestuarii]|uniref:RbsD/FucU family protein n=1 Tax=Pseudooceanicola aestuarii TaxID=2697319 RepID=UPI0013D5D505|nr:RbsD/FucU domain-containing protein [Pseudooceanicola aestuarii]